MHRKPATLSFLVLLVVNKDGDVVIPVVTPVVMAVAVIVVSGDIDRSVALKFRAVGLLCQVDHHWDMLVCTLVVQIMIHAHSHQALAQVIVILVVVVVVIAALLPWLPSLPLLSALGGSSSSSSSSRSRALKHHLDELVVLIHAEAVALAQVLLTGAEVFLSCSSPRSRPLWPPVASSWTSRSTLPGRPCSPASPPQA